MTDEKPTRKQAIRYKCLECCCDSMKEVRLCPCKDCPLWIYRMGSVQKEEHPSHTQKTIENEGIF